MKLRMILGAFAGLALVAGGADVAFAGESNGPFIELSVIQATSSDAAGSLDPRIHDLPSGQQPFAGYNTFKLLDTKQFKLDGTKPVKYALVNGRTVQVTLNGVSESGERRYQLETQISQSAKGDYLRGLHVTASENQPFFVGGQSYQGGTLFLELVVRP